MREFSNDRAAALRDALDEEIQTALGSGVEVEELIAVLGYFLETAMKVEMRGMPRATRKQMRDLIVDRFRKMDIVHMDEGDE